MTDKEKMRRIECTECHWMGSQGQLIRHQGQGEWEYDCPNCEQPLVHEYLK
jgi:NAD-dependent SIR2 family protein deacetylase